jgi:outer membrane protein assembly factor BamB
MARAETPLYVGTNGIVAALDPRTGEELWRTKLPKCGGVGEPVALVLKDQHIFAASHGQVWCLDARDGNVLWRNGLPRMGYHSVLLALEGADAATGSDAITAAAVRRRQQAAAAGGAGAAVAT